MCINPFFYHEHINIGHVTSIALLNKGSVKNELLNINLHLSYLFTSNIGIWSLMLLFLNYIIEKTCPSKPVVWYAQYPQMTSNVMMRAGRQKKNIYCVLFCDSITLTLILTIHWNFISEIKTFSLPYVQVITVRWQMPLFFYT